MIFYITKLRINIHIWLSKWMELLQFTLQIVQLINLVTFRGDDIFLSGHVLDLPEVVALKPVNNFTCPVMFHWL